MGSFTLLVFGTISGMGADCNCFLKCIAEKLPEKNGEPYHISISWIRTLLSFKILRLVHTWIRGSRTPFHKIPHRDFIDDCHSYAISNLRSFQHFCFIFNWNECFFFLIFENFYDDDDNNNIMMFKCLDLSHLVFSPAGSLNFLLIHWDGLKRLPDWKQ